MAPKTQPTPPATTPPVELLPAALGGLDPRVVMNQATRAVAILKDEILANKEILTFNGQRYIDFDDYGTIARFFGAAVAISDDRWVDYGGVGGFEAEARVVQIDTGNVLSTARAMCLRDEPKWSTRPKYEWMNESEVRGRKVIGQDPNTRRCKVLVGEDSVPLFQLRSMAQTRAGAKALRMAFGWVAVLAGFKSTPAEEMTGNEPPAETSGGSNGGGAAGGAKATGAAPATGGSAGRTPPAQPAAKPTGRTITQKMARRLLMISRKDGKHSDESLNEWLRERFGMWVDYEVDPKTQEHGAITDAVYEAICSRAKDPAPFGDLPGDYPQTTPKTNDGEPPMPSDHDAPPSADDYQA